MKNRISLFVVLLAMMWACKPIEDPPKKEVIAEIDTLVYAIAVDQYNTKWVATEKGLYKSVPEGYELQDLEISGPVYSLFYETAGNILWIGSGSGLLKATIEGDSLTDSSIDIEKLSNPVVLAYYVDQDSRRWFGTENGISLNKGDTWKNENFRVNAESNLFPMAPENFPVNSIASINGDYFFATSGARLYRAFGYDASVDAFAGATQWSIPYNGFSVTDTMFVVFIDNEGKKWMGGKEGIQVHVGDDPKDQGSFTYYYDELPDYYVMAINQDTDGDIWVGTRNGLTVFNGTDWNLVSGLPDPYVTSIAYDSNGSAWIGTKKGLVNIQ